MQTGSIHASSRRQFLKAASGAAAGLPSASPALQAAVQSPDILSAELSKRIDLDNDHYSSGFVIEVKGTTEMNETAKRWQRLQQKGHPIYLVQFPERGGGYHRPVMYHQRVKRGEEVTDKLAISYEAMEKQVANMDKKYEDSHYRDAKDYLDGTAAHELRIVLGEGDDEDTPTDTAHAWASHRPHSTWPVSGTPISASSTSCRSDRMSPETTMARAS